MNKIKILFFATLKERSGVPSTVLDVMPGTSVLQLKEQLASRFPELEGSMSTVLVSINREFAFDEDEIPEDAEIALFPPVSGG